MKTSSFRLYLFASTLLMIVGFACPAWAFDPTISGVSSSSVASGGATISWMTDTGADSQVQYGITTSYGASTSLDSTLVTSHSAAISGLAANTLYHYRVNSSGVSSADYTFTTTTGPIGLWTLDENTGTTASDTSGNSNNGTIVSGTWTTGQLGSAISFNGTTSIVNVGSPSALNNLSTFTWAFWAKAAGAMKNDAGPAMEKGDGSYTVKTFTFGPPGTSTPSIVYGSVHAGTDAYSSSVTNTYALNVWTHWAMTYDNAGDRKIHIYKNGVEVGYNTQTAAAGTISADDDTGLSFGGEPDGSFYSFNGALDDLRVYNRVLSGSELLGLAGNISPTITGASISSGTVGTSVTITGVNFGVNQGASTVKFNGTSATITSWSATSIVATVPAGGTTGNIVVNVAGTDSNGSSFTVVATPNITSLSTVSGAIGAAVTITGSSFGASQGTSTVKFNGTTATVTSWSATSIVTSVPTGATTGNIVVRAAGVDSNGSSFTVNGTPSITSLSVATGAVGTTVTITGTNFGASQGTGTVKFNGTTATVTSWSATSIVTSVPTGATTGNVVVRASGVNSNGSSFTVIVSPTITSLSITSGAVGATVTITGTHYGSSQGTSTVKFNGTTATVTSWGASSIVTTVPSGATTGSVVVNVAGVDSNGSSFTVNGTPAITSLSVTSGAVGTSVTITGSNFGATKGTSTVKFNGVTATTTSWSATAIVTTVPTGATTGNVVVHTSGVDSNGSSFNVNGTPTISSLSVTSGAEGTSVTVTGTNFGASQGTSTVKFNGAIATVSSWSATSIVTAVPTAATTGNVVVHASGVDSIGSSFTVTGSSSGPIGLWTLDENTGTTANDTSGNSNSGAIVTGTWTAGQLGSAIAFNGTTSIVNIGNPSALNNLSTFTWAFWAKAAGAMNHDIGPAIEKGDGSYSAKAFDFGPPSTSTPAIVYGSVHAGTDAYSSSVANTYVLNVWTHWAMTYDNAGDRKIHIYKNGAEVTYDTQTAAVGTIIADDNAYLSFGGEPNGSFYSFNGALDDLRVYNRVLSSSELLALAGSSAPSITSLSVSSAVVGSTVTIAGTNFGTSQGTSTVKFNGTSASVTSWSATSIVVTVPNGATTGNVVVNVAGTDSNGSSFSVMGAPSITSLSVTSGAVGTPVTIAGTNFGASQGSSSVTFNGATATVISWSSTSIVASVPSFGTTGNVVVNVSGVDSNGSSFMVLATPTISGLSITSGAVGSAVTITGTNFGATQGSNTVKFNGVSATVTSWSATSIITVVPTGAPTGNVVVNASGVDSNGSSFTVIATPSITSLSTSSGAVGAAVTISGTNFGATQGTSAVKFNGTSGTVTSWSGTSVSTTVPTGATTGNIVVDVSGVDSNGSLFTVNGTPSITSLSVTSGAVGTSVNISGTNFGATQGSSTLAFNGTAATVTSWSATSIVATVPTGAATGNVVVHTSGVDSNGSAFTVSAAPSITSLSITSGAVGAAVAITGSNFGASQGASTVKFNGTTATVVSWSATSVVTAVPAGATTGSVVVNTGTDSNGSSFTVTGTPSITGVSITSGAVGTAVTITGTNFGSTQSTGTVKFNGASATVTSWSDTVLTTTVPSGAATGNLVVHASGVDSNGLSFTVTGGPSITSLSITSGTIGATVTIIGTSFGLTQGTSTVKFNGTTATVTSWSATSLIATVPTGATTGNVVVNASGIDSNGSPFTVGGSQSISSLTPNNGQVGTVVTITGLNFGASQGTSTVAFNGTSAGTASSWSDSSIIVAVPSGASTGSVVVTLNGSASNSAAFWVPPIISSVSPAAGPIGTIVTITGSNFGATQGTSVVSFYNNAFATSVTSWSETSIVVKVPPGSRTGNVTVLVKGASDTEPSFSVWPTITFLSPNFGPVGTNVTVFGGNFGASQDSSTITFNGASVTALSWSDTSIRFAAPSGSSAGSVVVTINGVSTPAKTFSIPATVLSVSPTSGVAGTQVTIAGSGFGATQGIGIVWLGTTRGIVASWSDTQVVATVASGSLTGVARVQQGGYWSNSLSFAVATPTISSVTPASGVPGTQITIAGTGFGASRGNGQVWLGTANGVVQSWSDTQIVANVATGATTGAAQVLQNGTWSTSVPFLVSIPHIDVVDPALGPVGTSVTITGTSFGSSQGTGTITLGSIAGQVVNWSDTQIIANVATGSLTGISRIQQNSVKSNAVGFTVPRSGVDTATLAPNLINMVIGDTATIQALSSTKQAVIGLTWTSSDPSVVSLSSDDPPILSALTAGHVTISAGNASADVTVSAGPLPLGTVIWSNPSDAYQILSAVPSTSGVADVFSVNYDNSISAIRSDGTVAWTAPCGNNPIPDFQGGLIIQTCDTGDIVKIDGVTGQPYPAYTGGRGPSIAVHTDGTIFTVLETSQDLGSGIIKKTGSVIGIDPTTGTQKFKIDQDLGENGTEGEILIAGDGYAYTTFGAWDRANAICQLNLLRVSSSGAANIIPIRDWTCYQWDFFPSSVSMTTNSDAGVFFSLQTSVGDFDNVGSYYFGTTTGTTLSLVGSPDQQLRYRPVLQAQDGSFVGTADDGTMAAFDSSGSLRWSVPNETPLIATADGGVIAESGVTYNQYGTATGQINLATYTWTGNAYRIGTVDSWELPPVDFAFSFAAFPIVGDQAVRPHVTPQKALRALTTADLTTSSQCHAVMDAFAGLANIPTATLIAQIRRTAYRARYYVYDGPSDNSPLDPVKFPEAASATISTISQWFGAHDEFPNYAEGFSQKNGDAVWFRLNDWHSWTTTFGTQYLVFFSSDKLSYYAMGTVLHEVLHKAAVGGGFIHSQMEAIVARPGLPTPPFAASLPSFGLGYWCFGGLQ